MFRVYEDYRERFLDDFASFFGLATSDFVLQDLYEVETLKYAGFARIFSVKNRHFWGC